MPIKWRQFNVPKPKRDALPPFGGFNLEGQEGWPFLGPIPGLGTLGAGEPAVDIYQDKNNLYVEISLGGIKPEDVSVEIEDNVLIVSGQSKEKKEEKQEKDYFRREIIRSSSFRRVIKLPVEVKEKQASAESSRGVLKITIPKASKGTAKAKQVPIKIK